MTHYITQDYTRAIKDAARAIMADSYDYVKSYNLHELTDRNQRRVMREWETLTAAVKTLYNKYGGADFHEAEYLGKVIKAAEEIQAIYKDDDRENPAKNGWNMATY